MKHINLVVLLIFCLRFIAYAQFESTVQNDIRTQVLQNIGLDDMSLAIDQIGGANNQTIINNNQSLSNFAQIIQIGGGNQTEIEQDGDNNFSLSIQSGSSNFHKLYLAGNNNLTINYQNGYSNYVEQDIIGNNLYYLMSQDGNFNEIIQIENSPSSIPYIVNQRGDGLKLKIVNGGIVK